MDQDKKTTDQAQGSEPEYKSVGPPGMSVREIAKRNERYWEQQGGEFKKND